MRRFCLAITLSAAAAAHAAPPAHVEITFQVLHNGGPLAKVKHVLEHDGKAYRLEETWEASGLLSLLGEVNRKSRGQVTQNGLRPLEYEDDRPHRKTAYARFSWEEAKLTMEFRDGPQVHAMPAHAQDRLSFLYATAFKTPGAGPIEYYVADGKGVAHYVLEVGGRERVKVPAGEFDALRLDRRDDRGRVTQLWLDTGNSYLPVRLVVVQKNGTQIDQVAARIVARP